MMVSAPALEAVRASTGGKGGEGGEGEAVGGKGEAVGGKGGKARRASQEVGHLLTSGKGGKAQAMADRAEELRLGCMAASGLWMLAEVDATRQRLPVAEYAIHLVVVVVVVVVVVQRLPVAE